MIFTVFLYKTFIYEKQFPLNKIIKFTLLILLINNLRPNMIVPIIILFIFLYFSKFYKHFRKKILFSVGSFVLITIIFQSIIVFTLHPVKVPDKEYLAIPIQAVAKTYVDNGNISKEANDYFTSIQSKNDWKKNYNPRFVDSEKGGGTYAWDATSPFNPIKKESFVKYWLTGVLTKNIKSNIVAIKDMWSIYFSFPINMEKGVFIRQYISKHASSLKNSLLFSRVVSGIRLVISIPTFVFLFLVLLPFFIRKKFLLVLLPLFLICTGLCFTPAYQLRYVFPVIFIIPFLLICLFNYKDKNISTLKMSKQGDFVTPLTPELFIK